MYGYLDESGAPGVAINDNDFLVVSLVVFANKEFADKCSAAMDRLRKRLGKTESYEFHRRTNSSESKSGLLRLLPYLDFKFITIAIRKNGSRLHTTYDRMAQLLVREISGRFTDLNIEMDSNPVLYKELKKYLKVAGLKSISVKQTKSHSDNLIQLADYVVNISAQKAKQTTKSLELYRPLAKKVIYFGEIVD